MNEPTPYFKIALLTLGTLVLIVWAILNNAVHAAETRIAPVIERQGTEGVRKQIAWFTYANKPGRVVLYCVPEGEVGTTLTCAIFVSTDEGNAVVIVDGIKATEVPS